MGELQAARLVRHAGRAGSEMKAVGRTTIPQSRPQEKNPQKSGFRGQASNLNTWAFIALGSNIGDRKRTMLEAITNLQKSSDEPLIRSSFWQTAPVDCPPGS